MNIEKIKKVKWGHLINRNYSVFPISISGSYWTKKYLDRILPLKVEDRFAYYRSDIYTHPNNKRIAMETQIDLYNKKGIKFLWNMANLCEKEGKNFIKSTRGFLYKRYDKKSSEEILKDFSIFCEEFKKFYVFIIYPWSLESFFDKKLTNLISKYEKNKEKAIEVKKILFEPIKLNDGQKEQISFLKLVKKKNNKAIEDHIKRFAYFHIRWLIGNVITKKGILERINHALKENKDIDKEIIFLKNKPTSVEKETREIVRKYKISKKDQEMISLIKEYVYLRTYRTDVINHSLFFVRAILIEIAKKLKISIEDITYLTKEEIESSIKDNKLPSSVNLKERKRDWIFLRLNGENMIFQGKRAKKLAKKQGFIVKNQENVKQFKGKSAYGGIVKGIARIVLSPNDVKKVSRGDILVAVMTFPSYIMAMEKAGAFVTNEGGILCHAAIISREMNKPCIIGTKIATKVLKDGDLVEVDANKGIVKVIKRG